MEDSIFCKIVSGEIPCHKVYEDEDILAFLDINPISDGHTLVIPKKRFKDIHDLKNEDNLGNKLINAIQKVANLLKEKLGYKGIMVMELNGEPQEVPYIHFHVFGRDSKSPLKIERPNNTDTSQEYIKSIAKKLNS